MGIGIVLIAIAAGIMLYEKTAKIQREAEEYLAIHTLLLYLKTSIISERRTPAEAILSFSKRGESGAIPWLSDLTDKERVNSFFRERRLESSESELSIEDKNALCSFFADFGKHTAEEECERLSGITSLFARRGEAKSINAEKNVKSLWVLFSTAVLGAFILLI